MSTRGTEAATLGAVALGGGLGALARYGLATAFPTTAFPTTAGHFPWTTFAVNALGCLLIGVLMVLVTEAWRAHPLARPFLGVGVLGGFTTFSTYAAEVFELLHRGAPVAALLYAVGTVLLALLAVTAGIRATRAVTGTEGTART